MLKILTSLILISLVTACGGGGSGGNTLGATQQPPSNNNQPNQPTPPPLGSTTINVMVVFGQDAEYYMPGIRDRVQHLMFVTETAFKEGDLPVEFNIVHIHDTEYPNTFQASKALDDIAFGNHPTLNNVHRLRDQYRADIVLFYRRYANDNICGYSFLGGANGSFNGFSDYAYAVIAGDCPDLTTPHEIGHIFGLVHDRPSTVNTPAFPYGYGYGIDQEFATIMGVVATYGYPARLPLYSSPNYQCSGHQCGVEDSVDAIRALRNSVEAVSQYR